MTFDINDLPDDVGPEDIPLGFAVRELKQGIESGAIPAKYGVAIETVREHLKAQVRDAFDAVYRVEPLDAVGPVPCVRHPDREAIVQSTTDENPMCRECMNNLLGLSEE